PASVAYFPACALLLLPPPPTSPLFPYTTLFRSDLPEAISAVEQLTGVRAAPGGTHPTGTANALIAFTVGGRRVPHYLEVIGPDPDGETPAGQISTFGIADRTEPGVATFAVHPDDFDATAARAAEAGVHLG